MPYAKITMVSAVSCVYLEEPIKDHVTVETGSILKTMEGHVLEVCHIYSFVYRFQLSYVSHRLSYSNRFLI
jgi:hypothetical protein